MPMIAALVVVVSVVVLVVVVVVPSACSGVRRWSRGDRSQSLNAFLHSIVSCVARTRCFARLSALSEPLSETFHLTAEFVSRRIFAKFCDRLSF